MSLIREEVTGKKTYSTQINGIQGVRQAPDSEKRNVSIATRPSLSVCLTHLRAATS